MNSENSNKEFRRGNKIIMRKTIIILMVVCIGLLAIKLTGVAVLKDMRLHGDESHYFDESREFFSQYWETGDIWAPLQTAFLALLQVVSPGHVVSAARIIQLIAHTLTGLIIFGLGIEFEDERTGLFAAILFLVLPEFVTMSYLLFSETWYVFWFFGATWLYFRSLDKNRFLLFSTAGLCFGISAMFRSIALYFVPFIILHLYLYSSLPRPGKLYASIILILAMSVPISIQTIKNFHVYKEFLPVDTCGARNIWKSHNVFDPPCHDFRNESEFKDKKLDKFPGARPRPRNIKPAAEQREEIREAIRFIMENPGLTVGRTKDKIECLFAPTLSIYRNFKKPPKGSFMQKYLRTSGFRLFGSASYIIMMMLAAAGLILCREKKLKTFTLLLLGYHVVMNAFFFSCSRYRMAFAPILVLFAAWALYNPGEIWKGMKSWRGLAIIILWSLMLINWIPILFVIIAPVYRM